MTGKAEDTRRIFSGGPDRGFLDEYRMAHAEHDGVVVRIRWGSCLPPEDVTGVGLMRLGWPLFQLPMHLRRLRGRPRARPCAVAGHGADFWRLLGRALPEYEERRAELDELGRRMWTGDIA